MTLPLEQFIRQIEDSGVISSDTLQDFVPPKAAPQDAEALACELVRQKKLTKFQAEQICQGDARSLVLDDYVLLEKIGQGGMGVVYKAEHRRMKRVVAIKMLPPERTKESAQARFEREVQAAARLRHPNIVAADDAGVANGVLFLVMEFIDGANLSALVKRNGPLTVAQAINCILQAATGLEFAHKKGVVHRDIKPANLLLDTEGTVKILDMGLARVATDGDAATQVELTGTGTVLGTVDYMAPEQALSTKNTDARADIYSLGCTLYYLLTGSPTYAGETATAKLLAHQTQPIPALRASRADVPEQIEAVFRKMVAKNVEDRYQTMAAVIADLLQCCPDQSVHLQLSFSNSDTGLSDFLKGSLSSSAATRLATKSVVAAGSRTSKNRRLIAAVGVCAALLVGVWILQLLTRQDGASDDDARKVSQQGAAVPSTGATSHGQADDQSQAADAASKEPPPADLPFDASQARAHQAVWAEHLKVPVENENSLHMKFMLIPPGEFTMGSPQAEIDVLVTLTDNAAWQDHFRSEAPEHSVRLTKAFYLAVYQVTQQQFLEIMGVNPSHFSSTGEGQDAVRGLDTTSHPVESMTWFDAIDFCNKLSVRDRREPYYLRAGDAVAIHGGNGYRLLTEAEREYAARAGTTTRWSFGDNETLLTQHGWFNANSSDQTHPVGKLEANPFGIHDLYGNVWEWCWDWHGRYPPGDGPAAAVDPTGAAVGTVRALRGGGFPLGAAFTRSALRNRFEPFLARKYHGFRIGWTP